MAEENVKNSAEEQTIDAPETEEAAEATEEKSELDIANEKIEALNDRLMRAVAEFDNFKKRTAREKQDFYTMAVCETVAPFLAVLDNLDRAVTAAQESAEEGGVLEGIKMIKKQYEETLTAIGVEAIEAVGKEFDPERHNAVMREESDQEENIILEEFQKGYIYKDKVIRYSMVKVSA